MKTWTSPNRAVRAVETSERKFARSSARSHPPFSAITQKRLEGVSRSTSMNSGRIAVANFSPEDQSAEEVTLAGEAEVHESGAATENR